MDFKSFFSKRRNVVLTGLIGALLLYFLDVRFPLILLVIGINCFYFPMPSVFRTLISKIFLSFIVTFSLIVAVGAIQYVFLPNTDFTAAAVLLVLAEIGLILFSPIKGAKWNRSLFEKQDIIPLGLSLLAVAPFLVAVVGDDTLAKILTIANSQVVDAGHHFSWIIDAFNNQFLSLQNYPKGFYYGLSFMMNGFIDSTYAIGWRWNLISYFAHYLIMITVLIYALYYFALSIAKSYGTRFRQFSIDALSTKLLLALTVIPSVVIFYALQFVAQGFVNYFYVIAALICGVIYLFEGVRSGKDTISRWSLFTFLLIGFGVVSSWSPLIPLVLGIAFLYVLPRKMDVSVIKKAVISRKNIPLVSMVFLYFALLYAQFTSLDITGRGGVFESGNLHDFHYILLLLSAMAIGWFVLRKSNYDPFERVVFSVFVSSLLFTLCFVLLHYFRLGEIRYYPIKIALLLEVLCIVLIGAVGVVHYISSAKRDWRKTVAIPILALVVVSFSLMTSANPIGPLRELFKPYSGIPMPEFMEHDTKKIVALGQEGKLKHNNVITLHYNAVSQRLDGYPQLNYRANLMTRQDIEWEYDLGGCMDKINGYLENPLQPDRETRLVEQIDRCVSQAKSHGVQYYIVTDKTTVDLLKGKIDPQAYLVY